tara:strand:+ start:160 stop:414 length:255 start_codon:yes stop_codon:yes gene_type:complete
MEKLLTTKDLRERMQISKNTLTNLVNEGLPSLRMGASSQGDGRGTYRFVWTDVIVWLRDRSYTDEVNISISEEFQDDTSTHEES